MFTQKTELLYFRETMNADQAKQHNLVTRVLSWIDFDTNVLTQCLKLASHQMQVSMSNEHIEKTADTLMHSIVFPSSHLPSQPNDVTKQILQHDLIPKLKESLKIEQKHLIQYWVSAEYQEKLKDSETTVNV